MIFDEQLGVSEAKAKAHPDFSSYHEGYGVLMEEVEELFDEIKNKNQSHEDIAQEAADVMLACIKIRCLARNKYREEQRIKERKHQLLGNEGDCGASAEHAESSGVIREPNIGY